MISACLDDFVGLRTACLFFFDPTCGRSKLFPTIVYELFFANSQNQNFRCTVISRKIMVANLLSLRNSLFVVSRLHCSFGVSSNLHETLVNNKFDARSGLQKGQSAPDRQ